MNIYKNFLPKDVFKKLKDTMMGTYFPWYFNPYVNSKDTKENNFQFTFSFIKQGEEACWGEWIDIIRPVLKCIKHKKMDRVKANLLTRTNEIIEHGMHIDQEKGTTGILYINNCNGYTKFENGKKVVSEENKYVEFNSTLRHTGSTCTDKKRRIVINFNYEYI
tara:strand:+ start:25 stop:513 length:489 start_codon:yes stop_codon:yes gene_type:complete